VRMQRISWYMQLEGLVDMNLAEVGRGSYVVRAIGQMLNFKSDVFVNNCLFALESFQFYCLQEMGSTATASKFRELPGAIYLATALGEGQERR